MSLMNINDHFFVLITQVGNCFFFACFFSMCCLFILDCIFWAWLVAFREKAV